MCAYFKVKGLGTMADRLKRELSNRHIQLIAIGGAIGTGLFLGAGQSISLAGPSILLTYIIVGFALFMFMRAMGEMLLSDTKFNSFADITNEYVGPLAGFITGWTYWLTWIISGMAEVTAVAKYVSFWYPEIPNWLSALACILLLMSFNLLSTRLFGELEFWFAIIKVVTIIALIIMPYFIYKVYPPEIKDAREAQQMIREELKGLGKMSFQEWVMLGVFILALVLWATSQFTKLDATTVAFLGISILLATGVLIWDDVKSEKGAWDTLVWMGTLMGFAGFLSKLGFIKWATVQVGGYIPEGSWVIAFVVAVLVNTYAHYVFASLTAHISAMFVAFSAIAISAGAPPMLTLLMIAFTSNLCMSLTHYAAGPSPVIFNTGYVPQNTWWKLGFFTSVINLIIFMGLGSVWMKLIGMW